MLVRSCCTASSSPGTCRRAIWDNKPRQSSFLAAAIKGGREVWNVVDYLCLQAPASALRNAWRFGPCGLFVSRAPPPKRPWTLRFNIRHDLVLALAGISGVLSARIYAFGRRSGVAFMNAVVLMATPCPKSLHGKGEKWIARNILQGLDSRQPMTVMTEKQSPG